MSPVHRFTGRALGAVLVGVALAAAHLTVSPVHADVEPRVIGGSPGHPWSAASVPLEFGEGTCTGALWKPRIIVTAAHCVLGEDGRTPSLPGDIDVWAPGTDWEQSPPAPVRVTQIGVDQNWTRDGRGAAGDIAFLALDAPLGTPIISRMASAQEVSVLADLRSRVTFIGYGLTGSVEEASSDVSDVPLSLTLRLTEADLDDGTFDLTSPGSVGVCNGDSGGHFLTLVGDELVLLGVLSASSGPPCDPSDGGNAQDVEAVIASADKPLMNAALRSVGETADTMPVTCVDGPDIDRTCTPGRSWEYEYCWSGRRAILQERVGAKWKPVIRTSGERDSACPRSQPFAVGFVGMTDPGATRYRVVFPRQKGLPQGARDSFTVRSN